MENLENHCQQCIFKNREKWFDGEMELHDVENYFTSPLKLYKSGKFYIARANLNVVLNKPTLKIYDENEAEINMDTISDKTNVITILEIQGIKCSARSFQIELEVKQMMVLKPNNLFEKCIIAPSKKYAISVSNENVKLGAEAEVDAEVEVEAEETIVVATEETAHVEPFSSETSDDNLKPDESGPANFTGENIVIDTTESNLVIPPQLENIVNNEPNQLEEVSFTLDELKDTDTMQLKKRNDVYYEMYREARRKAKIAKDLALSSYLEAKRIKNTYMLEDIDDSDDSDLEIDDQDSLEN
jgi:hypothetical protein